MTESQLCCQQFGSIWAYVIFLTICWIRCDFSQDLMLACIESGRYTAQNHSVSNLTGKVSRVLGQQFSIKLLSVVVDPMWRSWIKQKGSRSEQLLFSEEEPPVKVLVSYCSWKFFWNDCVNVLFYLGKWLSGSMTLRFVFVFTHWLTKSVHFPSSSMIFLPARGTDFTWDLEKSVYGIVITSVEQT